MHIIHHHTKIHTQQRGGITLEWIIQMAQKCSCCYCCWWGYCCGIHIVRIWASNLAIKKSIGTTKTGIFLHVYNIYNIIYYKFMLSLIITFIVISSKRFFDCSFVLCSIKMSNMQSNKMKSIHLLRILLNINALFIIIQQFVVSTKWSNLCLLTLWIWKKFFFLFNSVFEIKMLHKWPLKIVCPNYIGFNTKQMYTCGAHKYLRTKMATSSKTGRWVCVCVSVYECNKTVMKKLQNMVPQFIPGQLKHSPRQLIIIRCGHPNIHISKWLQLSEFPGQIFLLYYCTNGNCVPTVCWIIILFCLFFFAFAHFISVPDSSSWCFEILCLFYIIFYK